ncbi:MAG: serine hydrolase [Gemmatimonadota bacterium]|nr:serine hydrolase [Gemmatimonadota bacterium]
MRRFVAAVLLLSAPLALHAQVDAATARRVDSVFAKFNERSPGCAVAIKQNGSIAYEHGYGMANLDLGVPLSPATVMDVGSVSKQFTATAIMLLAIDGKLSLDDDARKYLPELPDLGARVTVRHLLTHTSGWRDYNDMMVIDGWDTRDHTNDRDAWDSIKRLRALNFTPGSRFQYSNTGYFLLGQIVSRVSGKPFKDFARDRIFQPLGMDHTRFLDDTRTIVPNRATAYEPDGAGFVIDMSDWEQLGDGAVQTSVEDLAKWESNFDKPVVGGAKLLEMLLARGHLNDGKEIQYTAGLFRDSYRGVDRVQHGGAWAGYRASVTRYPSEHLAILMTCNRGDAGTGMLSQKIADIFLPAGSAERAAPVTTATAAGAVPKDLAGMYVSDADGVRISFELRGESLARRGAKQPLLPLAPGHFADTSAKAEWTFIDGKRVVLSSATGAPDTLAMVAKVSSLTPAELADYVGTYSGPEVSIDYQILLKDGALFARIFRGDDIALKPVFTDAFDSDALPLVRFVRDAGGRVVAMSFTTRGMRDVRLARK